MWANDLQGKVGRKEEKKKNREKKCIGVVQCECVMLLTLPSSRPMRMPFTAAVGCLHACITSFAYPVPGSWIEGIVGKPNFKWIPPPRGMLTSISYLVKLSLFNMPHQKSPVPAVKNGPATFDVQPFFDESTIDKDVAASYHFL